MLRSASFFICLTAAGVAHAEDLLPPQIVHEPCEELKRGEPFEILARFYDDSPIFDPKVIYRIGDNGAWKNAPFTKNPKSDDFKAVIPKKELKGPIEYFIEAFDENGNGPARYGSPESPIRVVPSQTPKACVQLQEPTVPTTSMTGSQRPQESITGAAPTGEQPLVIGAAPAPAQSTCEQASRPFWCEPLFWGAAGAAVVVGGGLGAYFLFFNSDDRAPADNQQVRLRIGAPDPTEAALRGAR